MRERPQEKAVGTRNPTRQVLDGFAYLLAEPRLRLLLAINAAPALLVYPYMNFMPIFAAEVYCDERAYGFLVAMIAVASIRARGMPVRGSNRFSKAISDGRPCL